MKQATGISDESDMDEVYTGLLETFEMQVAAIPTIEKQLNLWTKHLKGNLIILDLQNSTTIIFCETLTDNRTFGFTGGIRQYIV